MSGRYCFGDLVDHAIGGGWGSEEAAPESPIAAYVIRGTDIPRVVVGDVSSVPRRYHKESALRSRTLRLHDIVFEVSGGSKGQPVGRSMMVSSRILNQFQIGAICASFCKLIRLDSTLCNPRYVFRLVQQAYMIGDLDAFQVQSTGITNFRWKPFLEHFIVELPDAETQEDIARVLDLFDELILNSGQRIDLLRRMRDSLQPRLISGEIEVSSLNFGAEADT